MIIHRLLFRYFKYGDDELFYRMQAENAIAWLKKAGLDFAPNTQALDLGCGHGLFGAILRQEKCTVTFADQANHLRPELDSARFVQIDLDQDDYSKVGQYDLVVCSNVFEHLARPQQFIQQIHKMLRPTGKLYLSWTNWLSPFGGHDFAPLHYFGPRFGRWLNFKLKGKWSDHVPYAGLYPTYIGQTLKMLRQNADLKIMRMATRYYTEFSFILRIPVLREFLAWNCALLIGRRSVTPQRLR